jgi:hypothetical protein
MSKRGKNIRENEEDLICSSDQPLKRHQEAAVGSDWEIPDICYEAHAEWTDLANVEISAAQHDEKIIAAVVLILEQSELRNEEVIECALDLLSTLEPHYTRSERQSRIGELIGSLAEGKGRMPKRPPPRRPTI